MEKSTLIKNEGIFRDLGIYACLMRKALGSDTDKSGTLAARKKIMSHINTVFPTRKSAKPAAPKRADAKAI